MSPPGRPNPDRRRCRATAGGCVAAVAVLLASPAASFAPVSSGLPPLTLDPSSTGSDLPGTGGRYHCAHPRSAALPLHLALDDDSGGDDDEEGSSSRTNNARDRIDRKHPKRKRRTAQRREEAVARRQRSREENNRSPSSLPDGPGNDLDGTTGGQQSRRDDGRTTSDPQLEASIDSFLRGEYDRPFAEDAPAPHPGLGPGEAVDAALRSLRDLDEPETSHGAAVFLRFCAPLSRGDRWGGGAAATDPWKEVLRGAITPTMLARRMRASQFAGLLDWETLDVTEGLSIPTTREQLGVGTTVAFVNAAVFFAGDGAEPAMIQFTLRKIGGVWLIDTAAISRKEWFVGDRLGL